VPTIWGSLDRIDDDRQSQRRVQMKVIKGGRRHGTEAQGNREEVQEKKNGPEKEEKVASKRT